MKKLLIILVVLPVFAFGQSDVKFPVIDNKINYTAVVKVDSVSKDELYNRALSWIANTFKNSRYVVQMSDREAGEILGKGTFQVVLRQPTGHVLAGMRPSPLDNLFHFTVDIRLKKGKYKYSIYDFYHSRTVGANVIHMPLLSEYMQSQIYEKKHKHKSVRRMYESEFTQIDGRVKGLIAGLEAKMTTENTF